MSDPQKNIIKVDSGTFVLIVTLILLVPLLLAGFFFQ